MIVITVIPILKVEITKNKLIKSQNNNITTNVCDNKDNSNNRDYKNINKSKQRQ